MPQTPTAWLPAAPEARPGVAPEARAGVAPDAGAEHADSVAGDTHATSVPADAGTEDGQPAGPRPLGVAVTPTGHPEVDARLRRLADADRLEVSAHLEVYENVHHGLRSTLTALDQHDPGS
ncbi:hypothetical protein JJV70_09090 [Streptomyces sp. JJ66]|nr:hypothetical protein [Streptomyces sp. JJ66]